MCLHTIHSIAIIPGGKKTADIYVCLYRHVTFRGVFILLIYFDMEFQGRSLQRFLVSWSLSKTTFSDYYSRVFLPLGADRFKITRVEGWGRPDGEQDWSCTFGVPWYLRNVLKRNLALCFVPNVLKSILKLLLSTWLFKHKCILIFLTELRRSAKLWILQEFLQQLITFWPHDRFSVNQTLSVKGFTLKGKNFLIRSDFAY